MFDDYNEEVDDDIIDDLYDGEDDDADDDGDGLDAPDVDIDDDETFIPDESIGAGDTTEITETPPPIYPRLLTNTNSPLGSVVVQPGGAIYVNVELDFEDIVGVSSYEVRITPA